MKTSPKQEVDAKSLEQTLRRCVRGEVRFDQGARALYATDSSNYRQVPIGIVVPRDAEDVIGTFSACRKFGAPITSRGGGTSLAGQCCNVAVILDFTKYMHRIIDIDSTRRLARVEPGVILDQLNHATQAQGLIFGPDPATHSHCSIGGMIGNNSCGVHSVQAQFFGGGARTSDNIESLVILGYDGVQMSVGKTSDAQLEQIIHAGGRRGEIYRKLRDLRDRNAGLIRSRYPRIPRRVSGYNLDELLPDQGFHVARALAGTEGTCVGILEATLQLIEDFPAKALLVLGYPTIYEAGDHVPEVLAHRPIGLEGIDDVLVRAMKLKNLHPEEVAKLPGGAGWLLASFGGHSPKEAGDAARRLMDELKRKSNPPEMRLFENAAEREAIWRVRDSGLGASARVPNHPDTWEGWEDSAVPPERIGPYLRDFRALLERHGYGCTLYGHFGQGVVHTRIDFGMKTRAGIEKYLAFTSEAADLAVQYGGSLSGEHGDGQSRADLLERMFGADLLGAFREYKGIWDPEGKMNPGKIVAPYRRDEHLRFGTSYNPPQPETHFKFPEDNGSFAFALERCVGVGMCRRGEHGTMCPSYMVTREEMHSTRGRARLLWEMLNKGVTGPMNWRDEHTREGLDLCLACKGCKADCPVHVDMATYKAEFLSHYYAGRLRPVQAYTMGLIQWWARLASRMPQVANFFTQIPPFSVVMKRLGGISQRRRVPSFARQTFREWFAKQDQPISRQGRSRILLWPDTFNNFFFPQTLQAAVEVLQAAGFEVGIPSRTLCCGRPLYDWGMPRLAKYQLRQVLEALHQDIADGVPVIGLEPSCVSVFRDELRGLFPNDEQAARLRRQTFTLAEFLTKHAPDFKPPSLNRRAFVHAHCHQKSVLTTSPDGEILTKIGLEWEMIDSGCCGMAGAFGFEAEKYDISVACGERVLLPKIRSAGNEVLIIADGFSCREQIEHLTGRHAVHLAELLKMALDGEPAHASSGTLGEGSAIA